MYQSDNYYHRVGVWGRLPQAQAIAATVQGTSLSAALCTLAELVGGRQSYQPFRCRAIVRERTSPIAPSHGYAIIGWQPFKRRNP